MMGSSHLDHYHQEELHGFSSLATVPAFYDLASNREYWNVQNQLIQNCSDFISNGNGVQSAGHTDFSCLSHEEIPPVSLQLIQELGFHGAAGNNEEGFMNQLQSHPNQLNLGKVKEESPENCFLKLFRDHSSEEYYQQHEKLFVRALASDCLQSDGLRPLPRNLSENPSSFDGYGGGRDHNNFSRLAFPAANLLHSSPPHPPPSVISGLLDMDLHALDLLASDRLGRSLCQPSLAGMALIREDAISSGFDHLQDSIQGPFFHHHHHLKMPSLVSGVTEASRSTCQAAAPLRKPRFEQRPSFSPFKVRKEKLGDRIAALQQLVAPFGKTDTASVLMEAIGYIKFLLDQVEKLSVPYMGSSGNKRSRTMTEGSNEESDEPRRDLRSRGLCLVPLSCTSYMTTEHGVWSPIE